MPGRQILELEYFVKSSYKILYNFLATPSGLSEWFCDDVNIKNNVYTFEWDGETESAALVSKKANEYIKWRWTEDEGSDNYFEFRIKIDSLTNDVALVITDFCESDEMEESKLLWDNQVGNLLSRIGG